jgi:hypothetical protein
MKRLWKILTSRDSGREMLYWAADSKVGAALVILFWIVAHVLLVVGFVTGKIGWWDRRYDPYCFWVELSVLGLGLLFTDCLVISRIVHERRQRKA